MDPRLVFFILNCHLTPQGIVDLYKRFKKPRPIFDSSFRPEPWCFAINDWTDKSNEPEIVFPDAFMELCVWIYNLRITYPTEEIYLADDDGCGAFRHNKYNPNMVPMHCFLLLGVLLAATGTTFGDTTSPGNWEPIARARKQLAQHLWEQPDTASRAAQYLPPIHLAAPPTQADVAGFCRADRDSINQGVLGYGGRRRPPTFSHHVDDNMYADIDANIRQAVSASALILYELLGYPSALAPNALSLDKLDTRYTHQRQMVGLLVDSRRMSVGLLDHKRDETLAKLTDWLQRDRYSIREASEIHGTLESVTRYTRWGRALFFTLQNTFRHALQTQYHRVKRYYERSRQSEKIARELPESLLDRLSHLVAKSMAQLLWNSRVEVRVSPALRAEFQALYDDLQNPDNDWSISIGHLIPRDPHVQSLGDASHDGGGAHCPTLRFWFYVLWSDRIRRAVRLPPSHPEYVHINCLEFIVVILQLAAAITAFDTISPAVLKELLRTARIPAEPILLAWCDNTTAERWTNKVTANSKKGQNLVRIYAELLRSTHLGINCEHISSEDNDKADCISRPSPSLLSHAQRCEQIYQSLDHIRSWSFFQPSQELLQLLSSALFSEPWRDRPSLPKSLGRFVHVASTISSSPTL